ncbi:hypothetical protein DERP_000266 [Dermatophagoides pteronyssinus]|uniref:Uncharacterized protein n=1 Tax=Dermatophagoides pteronyssinus TaxID=6956 RepID=A0ABQ8IZP1_DERPT|nr:hypothetical protein DERP_000266 [Dermatophagoides pteronyssinus]
MMIFNDNDIVIVTLITKNNFSIEIDEIENFSKITFSNNNNQLMPRVLEILRPNDNNNKKCQTRIYPIPFKKKANGFLLA